jgi:antitoxin YefM
VGCKGAYFQDKCIKLNIFVFAKIKSMKIITFRNFRQNLKTVLDKVFIDHSPLTVTRANEEDVVELSKSDFESMQETFYLMKSPKNAERLLLGLKEYESELIKK